MYIQEDTTYTMLVVIKIHPNNTMVIRKYVIVLGISLPTWLEQCFWAKIGLYTSILYMARMIILNISETQHFLGGCVALYILIWKVNPIKNPSVLGVYCWTYPFDDIKRLASDVHRSNNPVFTYWIHGRYIELVTGVNMKNKTTNITAGTAFKQ